MIHRIQPLTMGACGAAVIAMLGCSSGQSAPRPAAVPPTPALTSGSSGGGHSRAAQGASSSADSTPKTYPFPFLDPRVPLDARVDDLVGRLTLEEKLDQMMHQAPPIPRLGIPEYSWWNEALHGVARSGKATVFPQAIAMAATFDPTLLQRVAGAISDEARAKFNAAQRLGNHGLYSGLTFWSPNINIFRDPRWGRGQETYGEDPRLTADMGTAFVKGLQGDDPRYLKTAACAKHFAVHSGPEESRHHFDARPSKRDLYETYLPAFEALVTQGKVAGVMSAYNRVYGEPASGSEFLLQEVLRGKWGFEGYVVSDCWALQDFHMHHRVTRTPAESAAKALKAGVNLNCGSVFPHLKQALTERRVTQQEIDEALATLLKIRFRLGLFDPSTPFDSLPEEVIGSEEHHMLARQAAVRSIVLLKNSNATLPLRKDLKSLMLLGPYVADGYVLLGNYYGSPARMSTLLEGVVGKLSPGASVEFKNAFLADRENPNPIDWSTDDAQKSDAILVTLGLSGLIEGEEGAANASHHKGDRTDLRLPKAQIDYVKTLRSKGTAPIIAVVFSGSPLALAELEPLVDAILLAWYPGQAGGEALADVIFGDASPGGRLPVTFPKSVADLPPFGDYSLAGRGYRFSKKEPQYPFGFGLAYSAVSYDGVTVTPSVVNAGEPATATVRVTNVGARQTDEVVQLYLTDQQASVRVPTAQLVGYQRLALAPGETKQISLTIPASAMQIVLDDGSRRYEAGAFDVVASGAAPGSRAQALGAPAPVHTNFSLTLGPQATVTEHGSVSR